MQIDGGNIEVRNIITIFGVVESVLLIDVTYEPDF